MKHIGANGTSYYQDETQRAVQRRGVQLSLMSMSALRQEHTRVMTKHNWPTMGADCRWGRVEYVGSILRVEREAREGDV